MSEITKDYENDNEIKYSASSENVSIYITVYKESGKAHYLVEYNIEDGTTWEDIKNELDSEI